MARRFRILVGATGSVASIKVPELVRLLHALENVEVQVVATPKALHFFDPQDVSPLCPVHTDQGEWATWAAKGDPVVHIELRKWADIIVVAPLDANTLAKVANGLCDNLLTCILRAWDFNKPCVVCPAMNTFMWDHPFTARHLNTLITELQFVVIDPISKRLACGDSGAGAMAEPSSIVASAISFYHKWTTQLQSKTASCSSQGDVL